jgi:head-tail adaptor
MSLASLLTDDIVIYKRTEGTQNDYGEKAETWNISSTVKGVIQPKSGDVARVEAGQLVESTHRLYTLPTVNIVAGDKVKDKNNVYYDVLFVGDDAGRTHHFKIDLKLSD